MMPSTARGRREWHLLTCEYPPAIGGVADHTFALASGLAAQTPVHVWCPAGDVPAPSAPGVSVHPVAGSFSPGDLSRLSDALDAFPAPRLLLVQWVPQGFGYRSINLGVALWMWSRAVIHGDVVEIVVHEPFLPLFLHPLRLGAGIVQRLMLTAACARASRVWLSTTAWTARVRRYVPRRVPIEWLPVPAAAGIVSRHTRPQDAGHDPAAAVIGHFGTHGPLVTRILAPALDVIFETSQARVTLIGRGGELFRSRYIEARPHLADRLSATGSLGDDALVAAIRECDLFVQPYPDGITTRRTSTLSLLALACPVVTNAGALTESLWKDGDAVLMVGEPDGAKVGGAAIGLLCDAPARAALGQRALATYRRLFDVSHAVARLDRAPLSLGRTA